MPQIESAVSSMTLYLAYDGYLTARQLGLIIVDVDDIHTLLCHGEDFQRQEVSFPDKARLRIERAETGSSIQLVFYAGQQLMAELLGLGPVVVGGAITVATTAKLLVGAFSRIRIERQRTQLGAIAVETERTKLELERIRGDIALRQEQLRQVLYKTLVDVAADGARFGQRTPEQNAKLASQLTGPMSSLDRLFHTGNLIQVALNGQDLVTPQPPSDSEPSS
jgi:hypothetical protein